MIKNIRCLFLGLGLVLMVGTSIAAPGVDLAQPVIESDAFVSADDIINHPADSTRCATAAFANGLAASVDTVSEDDDETAIQTWIYTTFADGDVLRRVLACPELKNVADDESIKFLPIEYTFPGGRRIVVNYETQPKILKQRLRLAERKGLPGTDNNPSPRIGALDDLSVWTNTDPAWYGILVVQEGALDEFVGDGKNNTISLEYIEENIDKLYPQGYSCTSKSALASDDDVVNRAVTKTVGVKDDSNDYYVAGDVNLQWISYLEIALDVVITVATFGVGTVVVGATNAARASRALKGLAKSLRALTQMDKVKDYISVSQKYTKAVAELKKIDKAKDASKYASKSDEVAKLKKQMDQMEAADKNVKQYKQASASFAELNKYRHALRGIKIAQRGNVAARAWRAGKAAWSGGKMLKRGMKLGRSSKVSGRIKDWLYVSTMKNIGALGKMEAAGGLIYGVAKFAGEMYDWTETSTGEFTNDVQFKPLLLLSADDLQGQENVVNHGMWLMWLGDSISAADDDAAYLQAMDFAEKFHQDLTEVQESDGKKTCNIDIYIVRPVLRNPGTDDVKMYYLIMNDTPWTTSTDE